jgi:hypothetical protein
MPKKPIDEDRIRRKELLEQKKAARKAAKEREDAQQQEAARIAAVAAAVAETTSSDVSSSVIASMENIWKISFMDLPLDAIHLIFSMLCVNDLGRLRMVYSNSSTTGSTSSSSSNTQSFHHVLYTARTSYLLSRLWSNREHTLVYDRTRGTYITR